MEKRLVTIARYNSIVEAHIAQGIVESIGIECFLQDLHVSGIYFPGLVAGITLQVREVDAGSALARLKEAVELVAATSEEDPQGDVGSAAKGNRLLRWIISLLGWKT